jgi:hypothetical protein
MPLECLRWRVPAAIVNDNPILSSDRMLNRDYNRKCSFGKTLILNLIGLVVKMNSLALNRQFDSDYWEMLFVGNGV